MDEFKERIWLALKALSIAITQKGAILYLMILKQNMLPKELLVGKTGYVILGIVNHEHQFVTYTAKVLIEEKENNSLGPIILEHQEKWEEKIGFTPTQAGKNIKVQFLLYRDNQSESYRNLHLWLEVIETEILEL
ncbi:hypothetical protein ES703_85608 [subsurface metagenome]